MSTYRVVYDAQTSASFDTIEYWDIEKKGWFGWKKDSYFTVKKGSPREVVEQKAKRLLTPVSYELKDVK